MILVEACVNSPASAMAAEKGGALRVELCDNLYEGGTTPSAAAIMLTRKNIRIGLQVIIRPRGGDFLYSDLDLEVMKQDILFCKENGVDGVVIGLLTPDGEVDVDRTRELVELARPMNVTFHRAFDMSVDPFRSLEAIINTGCDRILTSGMENKAWEGRSVIAELVRVAQDRIVIMAGSGINAENAAQLIKVTGVSEIHASARSMVPSLMRHQRHTVLMGGMAQIPEFEMAMTDTSKIKAIVDSIKNEEI